MANANANAIVTSLFLLFLSLVSLSTAASTVTLSLAHFNTSPQPPLDIYHRLSHLAAASLARAHHIKNPKPTTTAAVTTTSTPLSPHSYGGYSITLKFGTPPQTMPFVMDTGSSFVWFPCTHNYVCKDCNFSTGQSEDRRSIPTFIPKLSSTARIVGCLNPKCGWIHNPDTRARCSDCALNSSNCTQICPPYLILYGSGSTGGLALLDTLDLNDKKVPEFLVGCSLFSSRQPAGIAGFGRGDTAVPSQLGLSKFSYCLVSHKFDDTQMSSSLNLTGNSIPGDKIAGIRYTRFLKNPQVQANEQFSVYYYLGLKNIMVGRKRVKIPRPYLSPADPATGYGGAIVDSGTTFTYMGREIFEPVAREIETQARVYKRAKEVEALTGLRPCFNVSGLKTVSLPSLRFKFKGGAVMVFPLENYFSIAGKAEAVCLTVVTDPPGREEQNGPKVILGNFQQQNFYVEYDLKKNRFGFRPQKCA